MAKYKGNEQNFQRATSTVFGLVTKAVRGTKEKLPVDCGTKTKAVERMKGKIVGDLPWHN